jgi:hypothetical protein
MVGRRIRRGLGYGLALCFGLRRRGPLDGGLPSRATPDPRAGITMSVIRKVADWTAAPATSKTAASSIPFQPSPVKQGRTGDASIEARTCIASSGNGRR